MLVALFVMTQTGALVTSTSAQAATISSGDPIFGSYVTSAPRQGFAEVDALEAEIGASLGIVNWFQNWDGSDEWAGVFREDWVSAAAARGARPMISWEAWRTAGSFDPEFHLRRIAEGSQDAYLSQFARDVAAYGQPVWIRLMPEMNGDWTSWNGTVNDQTAEDFVAAWRHIVELFRAEGAGNAQWVWSPNETDEPRVDDNRMERYFPGEAYVDVVGIDGYNWGSDGPGGWRSFVDVFSEPYHRLTAISARPVWITETASASLGGDKAQWVRDMFSTGDFPRIEAIVWFHTDKERDWRMTSSEDVTAAFRESLQGTDTTEDPEPTDATQPVEEIAPPSTVASVAVSDMDGATASRGPTWTSHVAVAVADEAGAPAPQAEVSLRWRSQRGVTGTAACTTGVDGRCSVALVTLHKKDSFVDVEVTDLQHPTLVYDATRNTDPDGDSTGTHLRISKG